MPRTQATDRRNVVNTDRFGRQWVLAIEISTGDPTGLISPCFNDPLQTPMKYLSVPQDAPRTLTIDFGRWIRDLREAETEYLNQLHEDGIRLYGEKYDASQPPTKLMIQRVGPPPIDWRNVEKAMNGDRTPLGLEKPSENGRPKEPESTPIFQAEHGGGRRVIEIKERSGTRGWYDVIENGAPVNDTALRENEARVFAKAYDLAARKLA